MEAAAERHSTAINLIFLSRSLIAQCVTRHLVRRQERNVIEIVISE